MLPPFDAWATGTAAADIVVASGSDAEGLAARQKRRLTELLTAAARRSPLYGRLLAGRDPSSVVLQDLPIARKAELMGEFSEWIGDPAVRREDLRRFLADPRQIGLPFLDRYVVWESSGTSGEPAMFVQDAQAKAS
jgi:phenylacetate-CoA ligase